MEGKPYIYVVAGGNSEFLQYQKKHPKNICIHLYGGEVLRGRTPGKVIKIGTYSELWNIQDIEESIERETKEWTDPDLKKDMEDIDYGAGE